MTDQLNSTQRAAVEAADGPALVLAGAGSGKTRVIVERIVWLIDERGVDARNVLAMTFTNRAAEEMRSRVASRLGTERLASRIGTFHSFGLFILRREMDALGRNKTFTIFDDTDQLSLMKRLIKELPKDSPKVSPREALRWISALKQELESPAAEPELDAAAEEETYRALWPLYHGALTRASAVDFDDLIVLTAKLFTDHPEVLQKYRRRYQYVLIDEYQDTNRAQYVIASALSGEHGNLFVVGDEDQSIYSWRGADIQNILDFEAHFPGTQVFRLEQNYRSTAPILAAANAVVSHNEARLGKTLWTDREGGEPVAFHLAEDGEAEAQFVVDAIAKSEFLPRQAAVLYRTNGQARLIEEACLRKGLAYNVIGGTRFYGRKEIKDLLAYLRLVANPADDEALRRVVNVPPRGFGATSLEGLGARARDSGGSLLVALRATSADAATGARVKNAADSFLSVVDQLASDVSDKVGELLESLLEATGYREFVEKSDEKDFRTRLEVVDEFASACTQFDERGQGGLQEFLQELSLASDTDDLDPEAPAIALLTCHGAKGLEFDHVFLIGLEEGYLPHAALLEDDEDVEEERRLCYVAMTRARKTLTLSAARSRLVFGERKDRLVSRFVDEIPESQLARADGVAAGRPARDISPAGDGLGTAELRMGTRVRHAKFGAGVVMYTAGSGARLKVRIRFDRGISRQFAVSSAPLEILEGKKK